VDRFQRFRYNPVIAMASLSSAIRRWPFWVRSLVLSLLVAGQGRLILHYHAPVVGSSSKSAVSSSRRTTSAPDTDHCPLCKLASQTRLADLHVPAVAPVAQRVQDVVAVSYHTFDFRSTLRLSDRAPPAC